MNLPEKLIEKPPSFDRMVYYKSFTDFRAPAFSWLRLPFSASVSIYRLVQRLYKQMQELELCRGRFDEKAGTQCQILF